ncbi:MAG: FAD-dependent oxidoreductase [Gammaproteobacteria bacterium]|nr:MAG: FAD-dependent oxidoreductase [Gammaproteobacteria bacterium]
MGFNMIQTDYLIVGQGIAGTLFAHELEKHGRDFIVVDPGNHNASKTAAGMYNPVILKRFSPVWQGRQQILTAKKTIAELAKLLSTRIDYPMPIWRIFHDDNEKATWQKKSQLDALSGLLSHQFLSNQNPRIAAPLGFGKVNLGGRIDLTTLLSGYRVYLSTSHRLLSETLDYDDLVFERDRVRYRQHIEAKKIVCCEGYSIKQNPYFNDLPLQGNKGEVLLVKAPNLSLSAAIKSNIFIMPMAELGNDMYFVGATYNWMDKDDIPSEAAKRQLLDKLSHFVHTDIEVTSHRAGMRPTVVDRRPLLGRHPKQANLYILNGLGTRGVMLGATMTRWLYHFIEDNEPLHDAVDIRRFY